MSHLVVVTLTDQPAEVKGRAIPALDTPVSSGLSTPTSTNPHTRNQSPMPPTIDTTNNVHPKPADAQQHMAMQQQQQRQLNGRWMPSWRWLVAIVVLAVLGRLSRVHE